jgi:stage II sporulation protein M
VGAGQVDRFMVSLNQGGATSLEKSLGMLTDQWSLFSIQPVLAVWWQNARVMIISMVLGVFSFGVLGVFPLIATSGIAGYLVNLMVVNEIAPWYHLIGLILPHGIFELPAVIIAGAAVLKMGAVLATPIAGKTVGEVWIGSLAEWLKVMLGVVFPVLFIAAAVETWVTPRLAAWFF